MISTVTTVVSTIVSSTGVTGLLAAVGGAAVLTLLSFLVIKELATTQGTRLSLFGRNLNAIILPLFFVFSFIIFMKILETLS